MNGVDIVSELSVQTWKWSEHAGGEALSSRFMWPVQSGGLDPYRNHRGSCRKHALKPSIEPCRINAARVATCPGLVFEGVPTCRSGLHRRTRAGLLVFDTRRRPPRAHRAHARSGHVCVPPLTNATGAVITPRPSVGLGALALAAQHPSARNYRTRRVRRALFMIQHP